MDAPVEAPRVTRQHSSKSESFAAGRADTHDSQEQVAAAEAGGPEAADGVLRPRLSQLSPAALEELQFRMCDVYTAPRLPHCLNWNPILKTADDLKFGRFKGEKCPGLAKAPPGGERPPPKKLPEEPHPPMREKRPGVPRFRHPAPKPAEQAVAGEAEEADDQPGQPEGVTAAALDCGDASQPRAAETASNEAEAAPASPKASSPRQSAPMQQKHQQPRQHPLQQPQQRRRSRSQGSKTKSDPLLSCEWCGELSPGLAAAAHARVCKLRPVECCHCGQKLALASRSQHERMCAERPIAQNELQDSGRRSTTPGAGPRSGSTMSNRAYTSGGLKSQNTALCKEVMASLNFKLESFQRKLDEATKAAMLDDLIDGTEDCGNDNADIQELEATLEVMAQQLAVVELSASGGVASLDAQLQESPSQQLLPMQNPASRVDALVDLQRRISIFRRMIRAAAAKPPPPVSFATPRAPAREKDSVGSNLRPPGTKSTSSAVETPRRQQRPGQQLAPITPRGPPAAESEAAAATPAAAPSAEPSPGPRGKADSRASSHNSQRPIRQRGTSRVREGSADSARSRSASVPPASVPPVLRSAAPAAAAMAAQLPCGPGPAAVGAREATLEEMRMAIEQERQQYIADRLGGKQPAGQAVALDRGRAPFQAKMRSSSHDAGPRTGKNPPGCGGSRPQSSASHSVPSVSELRAQMEQERDSFLSQRASRVAQ